MLYRKGLAAHAMESSRQCLHDWFILVRTEAAESLAEKLPSLSPASAREQKNSELHGKQRYRRRLKRA
jgi:hypothetical protein